MCDDCDQELVKLIKTHRFGLQVIATRLCRQQASPMFRLFSGALAMKDAVDAILESFLDLSVLTSADRIRLVFEESSEV